MRASALLLNASLKVWPASPSQYLSELSSPIEPGSHNVAEKLLKVMLNTNKITDKIIHTDSYNMMINNTMH